MDQAMRIIRALIRITERADVFRHGQEELFEGINLAEVHCIHWVGTIDHANVTKIANEMGMTRGAICKICKKLVNKEMLASYQEPSNNKEIYYTLTERGNQLYVEHKKSHLRSQQEKLSLLQSYSDDEQALILQFLNEINRLLDARLSGECPACPRSAAEDHR